MTDSSYDTIQCILKENASKELIALSENSKVTHIIAFRACSFFLSFVHASG